MDHSEDNRSAADEDRIDEAVRSFGDDHRASNIGADVEHFSPPEARVEDEAADPAGNGSDVESNGSQTADLCKADVNIVFVKRILDELGIDILFDGTFRRRDIETDVSIEARLAPFEPTRDWLLDHLLLTALRTKFALYLAEARVALDCVTRERRQDRRFTVAKKMEPVQIHDNREEQRRYNEYRRRLFIMWKHYRLDEENIIPFWDLRKCPRFYREERVVAVDYYRLHPMPVKRLLRKAINAARDLLDPSYDSDEEMWFLREEPTPIVGVTKEEMIADLQSSWDRQQSGTASHEGGRRPRDIPETERQYDRRGREDQLALTAADFDSLEDYYRYKHEAGFVSIEDYEPTLGDGPYATLHRSVHPPRKKRQPTTTFITPAQFGNCYDAVAFANNQSSLMNTHVAVTWSTVGITWDHAVGDAQEHLCELIRKFSVETLKIPHHLIWVFERGTQRGLHSHMLLHMPPRYKARFTQMVERAVETISGEKVLKTNDSSTVHLRQVASVANQWFLFCYLMKGVYQDDKTLGWREQKQYEALIAKMKRPPKFQGEITGQRAGTSRCLGSSARKKAGFQTLWDQGERDPTALYERDYWVDWELRRLLGLK